MHEYERGRIMRIDFTRLITFLLVAYVGQIIIQYAVAYLFSLMGWGNYYVMLLVVNILIGFLFAYLYYPKEYRRGIFKNPEFYRSAGIFALIFLVIDVVRIFL